jgi:diguanylate cyclase (GGDEF)-like protein/putative nucleotidyltransferase with HDIG domain
VTSVPAELPSPEHRPEATASSDRLSAGARGFLVGLAAVMIATAPFYAHLLAGFDVGPHRTRAFLLAAAAALTQLLAARAPASQRRRTAVVFLVAAALLLPPQLIVLVGLATGLPALLTERRRWAVHAFVVCSSTLIPIAAWASARLVLGLEGPLTSAGARTALAGCAACAMFVALSHAAAATMARLAPDHAFSAPGTSTAVSVSTDLVLAALGVVLAAMWQSNAWLTPLALGPLLVVHRALSVPALQAEARVDSKTGLFNARHFAAELEEELARAARFDRPLSVIMADLDLLRNVNNRYGHLAGDAVLAGIADIFRDELRHYDVPARFGGEEFCILLPETPPAQALEIAERIRRAVAARPFHVDTADGPIPVTLSIGVASFPRDGTEARKLVHQADLAVYRAKLQGRNRVVGAGAGPVLAATPPPSPAAAPLGGSATDRSTAALERLAARMDARDAHAAGHSRRVQRLALAVGRELGLSAAELDLLGQSALLHDVGKLGIPDAILLSPGRLAPEERALMERHAEEGARMVFRLGVLGGAVPAIRHHHERFDGTGYPDGLRGEQIPLAGRIIHVADALDSMLTPRVYRSAVPRTEALEELRRGAGTQFCPRCVAALEAALQA